MVTSQAPEREAIHQAVDQLTQTSLAELAEFILFLRFKEQQRGSAWAKEFYDLFASVREAVSQSGMNGDEIDQLIDEAIDEVRRERDA